MIKHERSTPFQGALLGKQLITRRLSATADGGVASPVWSVREQGNKAAGRTSVVSFWRLFAASDVLQDISSRGLVYYCDRRCPKGPSQLQFGIIMQPDGEGAIFYKYLSFKHFRFEYARMG